MTVYNPELTWIDGQFLSGKSISVEQGKILSIDDSGDGTTPGAFLPGFVNTHSHAFQRGLRGLGETFSGGANSFWNWRDEMYSLVSQQTPTSFRELCVQAFSEMRLSGITTVGEFHYLHHDANEDYAFDQIVLESASEVGIRIVLLNACYMHAGFDEAIKKEQRRFLTADIDQWWDQVDHLASNVDGDMQRIGTVAHSVRAVDIDSIVNISSGALHRGMPMHIHVEEQRQEISACIDKHGMTPLALLNDNLDVSPLLTAVHCTHTAASDMEQWLSNGGNVCLCPLTEANLADGVCDVRRIVSCDGTVSIGTDSNARISMIEEMRWIEYAQRLVREERGVAINSEGQMAPYLIDTATRNGARALGIPAGSIEAGKYADFVVVDLSNAQLFGVTPELLPTAICCGGDNSLISSTIVNGKASP